MKLNWKKQHDNRGAKEKVVERRIELRGKGITVGEARKVSPEEQERIDKAFLEEYTRWMESEKRKKEKR